MKPKSQKAAIFSLLLSGQEIDLIKAFKATGSMKLSTRVHEFREKGCIIQGEIKHFKTKFGTSGKFMSYKLNPNKASMELKKYYNI